MNLQSESRGGGPLLAMAAVARLTGVGQHTLRAWERRFGFPVPARLPSGHRRFTTDDVARLRLVKAALEIGHRASDVVPLSARELDRLLGLQPARPGVGFDNWHEQILARLRGFERETIFGMFHQASAQLGIRAFLRDKLTGLLEEIGRAWRERRIDICHEHALSEIASDYLRSLRTPLEFASSGRAVLLATLPGESHTLGLQMAALTVALAGRRVRILGANTPVGEIADAAARLNPAAVALGVTAATATGGTARAVAALRTILPSESELWIGGAGSVLLPDLDPPVRRIVTLDALERELERLSASEPVAISD